MQSPSDKVLAMLAALRSDFLEGLSGRCYQLESLILQLPGSDRQCSQFEEVFRLVHSLKGAGGTHGFPLITSICHYFEDLLTQPDIVIFNDQFVSQALNLVDLLHQIAQIDHHDNATVFASIADKLSMLRNASNAHLGSVLVIESSKMVSQLLQKVLADMQLKAVVMQDSVQALQRLLNEPFDLLIVSLEMASLKGPALISAIQVNKGINANTPAILLTSQHDYQPNDLKGVKVIARSPQLAVQLQPHIKSLLFPPTADS